MKKLISFDFAVKKYNDYQTSIKNLYPGQFLELEIFEKPNGYKDILVKSVFGIVGELFSENSSEIIPYLENTKKYYLETYVKKFYFKEQIKLVPIIIIDVIEKSENFIKPEHPFLGDYFVDGEKYIWNEIMGENSPIKCSVLNINDYTYAAINLDEWEACKLVINGEILDVYSELGNKFGNLSRQNSQKLIPYLKNSNNFLTVNIANIKEEEEQEKWTCRLEISIYEKTYLKKIEEFKSLEFESNKTASKSTNNAKKIENGCFKIVMIAIAILFLLIIFFSSF